MEPTSDNLEVEAERPHVRHRHSRIPLDTVLWALLIAVALPLAYRAGWIRPENHQHVIGDKVLVWLALAFGNCGTLILALVRYPLYVRRHHHGFLVRELPHEYRPTFWIAYVLIVVGVVILFALLFKQRLLCA